MARQKWTPTDEQLEQIEYLAKIGLPDRAIARQLKISRDTFRKRKNDTRVLDFVLNRGRDLYRRGWL